MGRTLTSKKTKKTYITPHHRKSKIIKNEKVKAKSTKTANAQSHSPPNLMMYRGPNNLENPEEGYETDSLICFYTPKKDREDVRFQLNCLATFLATRRNQMLSFLTPNSTLEDSFSLLFVANQDCIETIGEILEDKANQFCNKNHRELFLPRSDCFDTVTSHDMTFRIHQSENSVLYSMDGRKKKHCHIIFYVHLNDDSLLFPKNIQEGHIKEVVDYIKNQKNLSLYLGSYFIDAALSELNDTNHLIQPVFSHKLLSPGCKKLVKSGNPNILPFVVYKGDATFKSTPDNLQYMELPYKEHIEQVHEQYGGVLLHGNACNPVERENDIDSFAAYHDGFFSCEKTLQEYHQSASLKVLLEKAMEVRDSFFSQTYCINKLKKTGLYGVQGKKPIVNFPSSIEYIWYGLKFILERDGIQIIKRNISLDRMDELIEEDQVIDSCTKEGREIVLNIVTIIKDNLSPTWLAYNKQKEKNYSLWCKDNDLLPDECKNTNLLDNETLVNEVIGYIRSLQVFRSRYASYLNLFGFCANVSYKEHKKSELEENDEIESNTLDDDSSHVSESDSVLDSDSDTECSDESDEEYE